MKFGLLAYWAAGIPSKPIQVGLNRDMQVYDWASSLPRQQLNNGLSRHIHGLGSDKLSCLNDMDLKWKMKLYIGAGGWNNEICMTLQENKIRIKENLWCSNRGFSSRQA